MIGPLRAAAKRAGADWHDLDLAGVAGREAFMRRCAKVLALPDYFGKNWDALHECLGDLAASGVPGGLVYWRRGEEFARRAPDAMRAGLEVFQEAAGTWGASGRTFLVIVDRASTPGIDLPPLR
jgi:RNAse (barnase) inhibitor barstar